MLIDSSNNPDNSLYVLGGKLISLLVKTKVKNGVIGVDILYDMFVSMKGDIDITMDYFIYILDWLFMLGLIEFIDRNNKIKICF